MAPSQAWRGAKALATAERARAEEGAGLVELMVAARVAETALVATEMAEAGAAGPDPGRVATRVEAASVAVGVAAEARAAAAVTVVVAVAVEARAVEARAAVAATVAVAGAVVVRAAEVKEAAA
jgi:hypothetical protein